MIDHMLLALVNSLVDDLYVDFPILFSMFIPSHPFLLLDDLL